MTPESACGQCAQIHRSDRYPTAVGHMGTMVVSYRLRGRMAPRGTWTRWPQESPQVSKCTGIVRRGTLGAGLEAPRGSVHADPGGWVCLPHFVGKLPHLFVNEEHEGPVQANGAGAGQGSCAMPRAPPSPGSASRTPTRSLSERLPTWHPALARGLRSVPEAIGSTCASSQHPVID